MFLNTIGGLESVFHKDIKQPKVILVSGMPGTMKSCFVYSLLTKYVDLTGEYGLYATLEESAVSYLNNMESLGLVPNLNLQITDYTDFREDNEDGIDYLAFTENMIKYFKETRGDKFTCFGFDSLGALYSLISSNGTNIRARMYHFFKMLRDHDEVQLLKGSYRLVNVSELIQVVIVG